MPRSVPDDIRHEAISMMQAGFGQREIQTALGLSRDYLRALAKQNNHVFPRNGVEVIGQEVECLNCRKMFRRSASKVKRSEHHLCSNECRKIYFRGSLHFNWKNGKYSQTFSKWITSQAAYKDWRSAVLIRDKNRCVISGQTVGLEAHHIFQKAEDFSPEKSFDVSNGITVCKPIHNRLHQLSKNGVTTQEHLDQVKKEFEEGKIDMTKGLSKKIKQAKEEETVNAGND